MAPAHFTGRELPSPAKHNKLLELVKREHARGKYVAFPLYWGVDPKVETEAALSSHEHLMTAAEAGSKHGLKVYVQPMDTTKVLGDMTRETGHKPREILPTPYDAPGMREIEPGMADRILDGLEKKGAIGVEKGIETGPLGPALKAHRGLIEKHPDVVHVAIVEGHTIPAAQLGGVSPTLLAMVYPDAMEFTDVKRANRARAASAVHSRAFSKALMKGRPEHAKGHGQEILLPSAAGLDMADPAKQAQLFRAHVLPDVREQIHEIHEGGDFSVLHVCGNANALIDEMLESGASFIRVDEMTKLRPVIDRVRAFNKAHPVRPPVGVIGNFSRKIGEMGEDAVERETKRMIEEADGYEYFVPGSGCMYLSSPATREMVDRNIRRQVQVIHGYQKPK